MPDITISLTEAQFAALSAAQEHNDLRDKLSRTPAEYLQAVVDGACASYAVQHSVDTVQGLQTKVAALTDAKAAAEAEAAAEKAKVAAMEEKAAVSK